MCVAAFMKCQGAAVATPAGSSASEDDAEESGGLNSTAHEWQRARRSERQPTFATIPAASNYPVPSLPDAAAAMASRIVRFVKFVAGDNGQHSFNNVALSRCNDSWVFCGVGETGEWRPGKWWWRKQEREVITLTYARKHGSEVKTRSFERNALGWYVTNGHTSASDTKVLYLLPRSTLA